ncbi:hypothetical protein [Paenibacillus oleatilyticus]|uniref:Copper amine oxidase-like N-terminal domain-containing protein n=1 Tax=Paenibacillus oleatilyticus TaxID=2594886 RepID=A0ABV4VCJ0_9BACL
MMRKYVIGGLVGFVLALGVSVQAEEIQTAVGKVIQGEFPVTIGDKQFTNKAIVVDGTSYFPVREYGEANGYDVKFDADLGIILTKTVTDGTYSQPNLPNEPIPVDPPPKKTVAQIDEQIKALNINIWTMKAGIESSIKANDSRQIEYKERLKKYESELAELEKEKAELEKQQAPTK